MSANPLTSDRQDLILKAAALPLGSPERRAILAGLKSAGRGAMMDYFVQAQEGFGRASIAAIKDALGRRLATAKSWADKESQGPDIYSLRGDLEGTMDVTFSTDWGLSVSDLVEFSIQVDARGEGEYNFGVDCGDASLTPRDVAKLVMQALQDM